jgi:Domain of unknown function (DUF5753)
VTFLIDEQTLYRPVGTAETMREQLEHLLSLSELPNVTVPQTWQGSHAFWSTSETGLSQGTCRGTS